MRQSSIRNETALRGAILLAKIVAALHRQPCVASRRVASKTKRSSSPILRRISYPPRSGIREHFIIRVTVASEQTRADNATLRENAASPCASEWEIGARRVAHIQTNKDRGIGSLALLPFLEPFRFISSLGHPLLPRIRHKTDSLLFLLLLPLVGGTKVGFSTYPRSALRT